MAEESGREFVAAQRKKAREAFERFSPQARALVRLAATMSAEEAKKWATFVEAFFDDESYEAEQWLNDGVALTVGHWSDPLASLGSLVLKKAAAKKEAEPTKFVFFTLDELSEATDPVAIDVDDETMQAIRNGEVDAVALESEGQTIPKENIRFSIADDKAYVSLVGLGELRLRRGNLGGAVRVKPKRNANVGQPGSETEPETIGAISVTIDPAPTG